MRVQQTALEEEPRVLVAGERHRVEPAHQLECAHDWRRLPLCACGLQLLDDLAEDGRVVGEGGQCGGGDLRTQREASRRETHQGLRVRMEHARLALVQRLEQLGVGLHSRSDGRPGGGAEYAHDLARGSLPGRLVQPLQQ